MKTHLAAMTYPARLDSDTIKLHDAPQHAGLHALTWVLL